MAVADSSLIIPGKGAASIRLGEKMEDILARTTEVFLVERVNILGVGDIGVMRYRSTSVDLWVKDSFIFQIMVHTGYTGKFLGKIGLGSTLTDVENLLGPLTIVGDNLVIKGIPGISFEPCIDSPDASIVEIYVWEPDWVEIRDHQT